MERYTIWYKQSNLSSLSKTHCINTCHVFQPVCITKMSHCVQLDMCIADVIYQTLDKQF